MRTAQRSRVGQRMRRRTEVAAESQRAWLLGAILCTRRHAISAANIRMCIPHTVRERGCMCRVCPCSVASGLKPVCTVACPCRVPRRFLKFAGQSFINHHYTLHCVSSPRTDQRTHSQRHAACTATVPTDIRYTQKIHRKLRTGMRKTKKRVPPGAAPEWMATTKYELTAYVLGPEAWRDTRARSVPSCTVQ